MKKVLILSISSDIGSNIAKILMQDRFQVFGTYNNFNKNLKELSLNGARLFKLNLSKKKNLDNFLNNFWKNKKWDLLILSAGTQEPIGPFNKTNFNDWRESININFIAQVNFLHSMLKYRNKKKKYPRVIFFAGGGTNNATLNYSAYTISKIASIKLVELLDAEIKDTIFTILGPGWVKTKIHDATIKAKNMAGKNYNKTLKMLNSNKCYSMEDLMMCIRWLLKAPKSIIGGRNFSAVHDPWQYKKISKIKSNNNIFKLRRYGNEIFK